MTDTREVPDARCLIASLVGNTIPTLTGRPNRVLRIEGDHVIVGTSRSPHGQPVQISTVQSAIDQLYSMGNIAVTVETVGYRSAFIGAVLRQLPGVRYTTNPREVWISGTQNE